MAPWYDHYNCERVPRHQARGGKRGWTEYTLPRLPEPVTCNSCGRGFRYNIDDRKCSHCGRYVYGYTPAPEPGHPFPHNHEPTDD